ncbi:hypothetical protein D3C87_2124930 [compost metagenome]
MFRDIVRRADIAAWFYRQHIAGLQHHPIPGRCFVFPCIMHIQPQPVPGPMHVKLAVTAAFKHGLTAALA